VLGPFFERAATPQQGFEKRLSAAGATRTAQRPAGVKVTKVPDSCILSQPRSIASLRPAPYSAGLAPRAQPGPGAVAGVQGYEVRYTAKKTRKSASAVKTAVKKVGSSKRVERRVGR